MIQGMTRHGALEVRRSQRYRHRFLMNGTPIDDVAPVGRKRGEAPLPGA